MLQNIMSEKSSVVSDQRKLYSCMLVYKSAYVMKIMNRSVLGHYLKPVSTEQPDGQWKTVAHYRGLIEVRR